MALEIQHMAQIASPRFAVVGDLEFWKLGLGLVALVVGVAAALWIRRVVLRALSSVVATRGIAGIGANIAGFAVLGVATAIWLNLSFLEHAAYPILGVVITIGVAFALGFQQLLANYIAGIALAFKPLFEVGDVVELEGIEGTVLNQNLRETTIRTFEGTNVTFPNRDIFFSRVVNLSASGKRRIDVRFCVPTSTNLATIHDVCASAVEPLAFRDPARDVAIYFESYDGTWVTVVVSLWVDWKTPSDFLQAKSDAIHAIVVAVERATANADAGFEK